MEKEVVHSNMLLQYTAKNRAFSTSLGQTISFWQMRFHLPLTIVFEAVWCLHIQALMVSMKQ